MKNSDDICHRYQICLQNFDQNSIYQLNILGVLIYFSLLYSATAGDLTALKRFHFSGVNMSNANYDGRTALHLAAAEGHASCVKFLVESCKLNPLANIWYEVECPRTIIWNVSMNYIVVDILDCLILLLQ